MEPPRVWCRISTLSGDGRTREEWVIEGGDGPDLAVVDRIARRVLAASRAGGRVVLDELAPELRELLDLVALRVDLDGTVEVQREAELGE